MKDYVTFLADAAHVKPSLRQIEWFRTGFYAFIHFTVNTYTGRQWGLGDEDPAIFNPTCLDCDAWVAAIKAAGMKGAVITAKHHDGFCLWPSKYTEHSVKNSPWKNGKGDVVRELADACRRGGIKFGFYLSPWDRHEKTYGTPAYNDYYANQLTELLTEYGEVFIVWQDNACGEGANGKRQVYDFDRFNSLVRKYQPNAVIYNDYGPDVRWCGNETGETRAAEWAIVPHELCHRAEKQTTGALLPGGLKGIKNSDRDLGTLLNIQYSDGLCFAGAEVDTSIRPQWFYDKNDLPRTVDNLFDLYIRTVGGNACLNLNIPPMPNGRFDPVDEERLYALGERLREEFRNETAATLTKICDEGYGRSLYEIKFERPIHPRYIELAENIAEGQRVECFQIRRHRSDGAPSYAGLTIGARRICQKLNYWEDFVTNTLYLRVTARAEADILYCKAFARDE